MKKNLLTLLLLFVTYGCKSPDILTDQEISELKALPKIVYDSLPAAHLAKARQLIKESYKNLFNEDFIEEICKEFQNQAECREGKTDFHKQRIRALENSEIFKKAFGKIKPIDILAYLILSQRIPPIYRSKDLSEKEQDAKVSELFASVKTELGADSFSDEEYRKIGRAFQGI
jgi:hypothetical protein